jgi:surfeit locus 1 family protein
VSAVERRRFRPGLPATLFAAFFLPLLLALGSWQVQRAGEKRALYEDFAAGGTPVLLEATSGGLDALRRYAPVRASGRYLADRQFLLDNMVESQQAGYRVLTPLLLDEGRAVLVDRGWIPRDFGVAGLPAVTVDADPRSISGRIDRLPRPGLELAAELAPGWPKVVQFPTQDELSLALGLELVPGVVLLDPAEPDGYRRDWRPSDFGPERHVGYAVQWFALALTLVILYLVWSFRKSD